MFSIVLRGREEFDVVKRALENARQLMKMGLNGVAMNPHGLIFDEDEATGCPMPLEPFPTSFRLVLAPF